LADKLVGRPKKLSSAPSITTPSPHRRAPASILKTAPSAAKTKNFTTKRGIIHPAHESKNEGVPKTPVLTKATPKKAVPIFSDELARLRPKRECQIQHELASTFGLKSSSAFVAKQEQLMKEAKERSPKSKRTKSKV